jgi:hypothetical protein
MEDDIVGLKASDARLVLGVDISENSIFALSSQISRYIQYSSK